MPFILPVPLSSPRLHLEECLDLGPRPETTFPSPIISHTWWNLAGKFIHFSLSLLIVCLGGSWPGYVSGIWRHSIWVNGKSKHEGGLGK